MNTTRTGHRSPTQAAATETDTVADLARGMADDFNNILTTVMGACALIDRDRDANGELRKCVELIRSSAERAAKLTNRLLSIDADVRQGDGGVTAAQSPALTASIRDNAGAAIVSSPEKTGVELP